MTLVGAHTCAHAPLYRTQACGARMISICRTFSITLSVVALSLPLSAQSISIGLRGTGSIPTGTFAEDQTAANDALITGAKNGFGYGLDLGLGLGPIGVYAGFD